MVTHCAGCGKEIMPATADDASEDRGPWYCAPCFEIERDEREWIVSHGGRPLLDSERSEWDF